MVRFHEGQILKAFSFGSSRDTIRVKVVGLSMAGPEHRDMYYAVQRLDGSVPGAIFVRHESALYPIEPEHLAEARELVAAYEAQIKASKRTEQAFIAMEKATGEKFGLLSAAQKIVREADAS